jgi:hypothetical protein
LFRNQQNDLLAQKLRQEKINMLVKIFVINLKDSVAERRRIKSLYMSVNQSDSINKSQMYRKSSRDVDDHHGTYAQNRSLVNDSESHKNDRIMSPVHKAVYGFAMPMVKSERTNVIETPYHRFSRRNHGTQKRASVTFKESLNDSPRFKKPNKEFAIFPHALEHQINAIPTVPGASIGRHIKRINPTITLTSSPPQPPSKSIRRGSGNFKPHMLNEKNGNELPEPGINPNFVGRRNIRVIGLID